MNVLVISQLFPPETAAGANRVGAIVGALESRHDVRVVTLEPGYPDPALYRREDWQAADRARGTQLVRRPAFRPHDSSLARRALREIRIAIDRYKRASDQGLITRLVGASGYPPNLDVLVSGVQNLQDPKGGRMYFLRRLPRDPFAATTEPSAAATWGLRSYASAPDDPHEGDDVFDVYSRAPGVGLNGQSYREW